MIKIAKKGDLKKNSSRTNACKYRACVNYPGISSTESPLKYKRTAGRINATLGKSVYTFLAITPFNEYDIVREIGSTKTSITVPFPTEEAANWATFFEL